MGDPTPLDVILLAALGVGTGWLGALIGIGGGIVLVPVLVIGFGLDMRIAVATSLVAVIATSTAAGSVYVGSGQVNTRLAGTLEIATTTGGVVGGLVAQVLPTSVLAAVFAIVVGFTAVLMARRSARAPSGEAGAKAEVGDGWEEPGALAGAYFDPARGVLVRYRAARLWLGSTVSLLAGAMSGMLGVGGGFLKVPAMNLGMDVPIKVAAATSNFMIGVTAAASVFVYYGAGYVHPLIVVPAALGIMVGAIIGSRHAQRASHAMLARVMSLVLAAVAVEMGLKAFGVQLGR